MADRIDDEQGAFSLGATQMCQISVGSQKGALVALCPLEGSPDGHVPVKLLGYVDRWHSSLLHVWDFASEHYCTSYHPT